MADPYEPDRPVICPYDSSHRIALSRIQKHLVKCAKVFIFLSFILYNIFVSVHTRRVFKCQHVLCSPELSAELQDILSVQRDPSAVRDRADRSHSSMPGQPVRRSGHMGSHTYDTN